MATELLVPKLEMAMTEATVVTWLKADGEWVVKGEPVVAIETEKVNYEVEAPAAGRLVALAEPQTVLAVGSRLGWLATNDAEHEELTRRRPAAPGEAQAAPRAAPAAPSRGPRVAISPLAKVLAEEEGVAVATIVGTGPGGRIVERDVRRAIEERRAAAAPQRRVARRIPLVGTRRTIAERMMRSLQTMAQLTATMEVDVTNLVEVRRQLVAKAQRLGTPATTYNDLLVRAVARALEAHPIFNSTVEGDEVLVLADINVGVAVGVEGGLIVPVVHGANSLSLEKITRRLAELVAKAQARTLTLEEVSGGTFTISNVGAYGVEVFTPIINPPESAILGVGRMAERPVVMDGQVRIRTMMHLSLTFDHRVADGVPAAAFLAAVKELLESPVFLLQ